jgi:hypothetical protein
MNTYEKCKKLRFEILSRAAAVMNYTDWSADFAVRQIREIREKTKKEIGAINIAELTVEQMKDLGFCKWSNENPIYLIPLWLYEFLPDEIETRCINGGMERFKSAMSADARCGLLAYGILPNNNSHDPKQQKTEA